MKYSMTSIKDCMTQNAMTIKLLSACKLPLIKRKQKLPHCQNNSKIKYQTRRQRLTPYTQITCMLTLLTSIIKMAGLINIRENRKGNQKTDNLETLTTLGTQDAERRETTTQLRKLKRWARVRRTKPKYNMLAISASSKL